uniref:Lactose synthase B protein n=1 Tax=Equus asinus TaxID=9793 RepID=A0A9L0JKG9_EQUAS
CWHTLSNTAVEVGGDARWKESRFQNVCLGQRSLSTHLGLLWICTIFHSSGYDTQTIVKNNGKTEYGLFQINNKMWCRDNQILPSRNICGISCNKFLDDDLTDDVMCAKKILDSEGIDYWLAHKPLCSEKLEQWLCEEL